MVAIGPIGRATTKRLIDRPLSGAEDYEDIPLTITSEPWAPDVSKRLHSSHGNGVRMGGDGGGGIRSTVGEADPDDEPGTDNDHCDWRRN